jgi:peptidylprolyl isomerase
VRRTAPLLALVLAVPLALAGCSGGGGDDNDSPSTGASGDLPTVSGEFGEKPTVEVPDQEPADELVVEVLNEGDGDEVVAAHFLVADYLGQVWEPGEANVFDNSYDSGQPAGFAIGTGNVIAGWDEGLVGQKVGSRVLLVVPPEQGYGAEGTPDGSIPPDSTLVFVVDIVDTVPEDAAISGTPVPDLPADLPKVTGDGVEAPTVDIAGAQPPAESGSVLLVAGDGEPIRESIVVKVLQVSWATGETQFSSWDQAPAIVTPDQLPGLAQALEGQNVGSRVLTRVSATDNTPEGGQGEPLALVLDVVGTV